MAGLLSPELLAQFDALTSGFKQRGNLGQLSPELLAYLASMQSQGNSGGTGLLRGFATPDGRSIQPYGSYAEANPNGSPDSSSMNYDPSRATWGGLDFMLNTDESNDAATFDQNGNFIGYERRQDDKDWKDFITAAAMIAGGYYGGGALSDWAGAAGAAEGVGGSAAAGGGTGGFGGEALSGMDLAADAAVGTGNNIMTAGEGLSGASAGTSGLSNFRQGEIANYGTNGSMPSSAASTAGNMTAYDSFIEGLKQAAGSGAGSDPSSWANTVGDWFSPGGASTALQAYNALSGGGNGSTLGGLLGAYLSYQDAKDKEQTSKTEPWGPAKPYLEGLLREGGNLWGQYQAQPFSPAEQTAYGNYGNVLDFINGNAGRFMSGFDATARGANQFSRSDPRRPLIGNSYDAATSPVAWQPGLLGAFGTRKG
jgi:hypothetical protein